MALPDDSRSLLRPALLAGVALLVASCATARIDWGARVGLYSYDQAVVDLGPPDKEAELTDGRRVADWLMRPGRVYSTVISQSYFGYGYCSPVYPLFTIDHYAPGSWLRLEFDADGKLAEWKRYYK